jgi:hypothetical protein
MTSFTTANERTQLHKSSQIASGRCAGCSGDTDKVLRAQPAFPSNESLFEHPRDHLFLARLQLSAKSIVELGFCDIEFDVLHRRVLCFQDRLGEVDQPASDLVFLIAAFEPLIVGLAIALDGIREPDSLDACFTGSNEHALHEIKLATGSHVIRSKALEEDLLRARTLGASRGALPEAVKPVGLQGQRHHRDGALRQRLRLKHAEL